MIQGGLPQPLFNYYPHFKEEESVLDGGQNIIVDLDTYKK